MPGYNAEPFDTFVNGLIETFKTSGDYDKMIGGIQTLKVHNESVLSGEYDGTYLPVFLLLIKMKIKMKQN